LRSHHSFDLRLTEATLTNFAPTCKCLSPDQSVLYAALLTFILAALLSVFNCLAFHLIVFHVSYHPALGTFVAAIYPIPAI